MGKVSDAMGCPMHHHRDSPGATIPSNFRCLSQARGSPYLYPNCYPPVWHDIPHNGADKL